jgi:hypothetical protein
MWSIAHLSHWSRVMWPVLVISLNNSALENMDT